MSTDQGNAYDWDDPVKNEQPEFIVLEPAKYEGVIVGFKRGRKEASEKMGACPKAMLDIKVTTADGKTATIKDDIFLHSKFAWKIEQFFAALIEGKDHKHGDQIKIDWANVLNKKICVEVSVRNYSTRADKESAQLHGENPAKSGKINQVDRYLKHGSSVESEAGASGFEAGF